MFSRFNSDGNGSPSPNSSNSGLNSTAASFFKMALNSAQQFANNNVNGTPASRQDSIRRVTDELASNDKVLHTNTPNPENMTQPEDEPEESTPTPDAEGTPDPRNIISGIDVSKLTPELRAKMKKFGKYEEKYPVLLDAYKTEKLKTSLIGKFEKLLQEHTPCAKISESEILFQYLDDLKQKNDLINTELKKVVGQLSATKEKATLLELDNSKYKTIVKNLQQNDSKLKVIESSLETKELELTKKSEEIESLQKSLLNSTAELEGKLSDKDAKISELESKLEQKGNDEDVVKLEKELQQELDIKAKKIEELEKRLLDNEKPELEPIDSGASAPLSKSAKKKNKKKKNNVRTNDAVKETEIVPDDGTDKIAELEASIATKDSIITDIRLKLEQTINENTDLKQEITNSKEEVEHLKDSLREVGNELVEMKNGEQSEKTLHMQHTELITTYEKTVKSLKDDMKKLDQTIESLNQANDALIREKQILLKQNDELSKVKDADIDLKLKINNLNKLLESKEKQNNELLTRIKYSEEEKNSLNEKYIELKVSIENLKSQIKSSNEQSNKLMTETEQLKETIRKDNLKMGKLSNENSILLKNRDELKDKLTDLTHLKSNNSDQVNNLIKVNEELNVRLRELTTSYESLQEELNDSRIMLQERSRETSTIRKLLVELEDEKQKITKEFELKLVQRGDEIDQLNFKISKMNKKNKADINELTLKLQKYEEELVKGKEVVERPVEITPSISTNSNEELLDSKITALQRQLTMTDSKLKEYENMNSILKKLNDEMSLKFEKLNKNYRLQQLELKRSRNDSVDLQRRLSSASTTTVPVTLTTAEADTKNGSSSAEDDDKVSYIKNVLIGFIEKKEQRSNLLPVIKMVLKLDDQDVEVLNNNLK